MDTHGDRSTVQTPERRQENGKSRRSRKHVSCTQCRLRKIKCDRNVPNCSSCVQRGIRHQCHWGDERDYVVPPKSAQRHGEFPLGPSVAARGAFVRAPGAVFDGAPRVSIPSPRFPFIRPPDAASLAQLWESDREAWRLLMSEQLCLLPERSKMLDLLAFYTRELEPLKCCINGIVLRREIERMYAELLLAMHAFPVSAAHSPSAAGDVAGQIAGSLSGAQRRATASLLDESLDARTSIWGSPQPYGLVALAFALVHTTCEAMKVGNILSMPVFPSCETAEQVTEMMERAFDASLYFMSQADGIDTPTLWVLQTILCLERKHLISKKPNSFSWNLMGVHMAQWLGLNRLGTAARDVERVHRNESVAVPRDLDADSFMPGMNEFSDDNLVRRELGRRIWNRLVMTDWMMAAHLDFSYAVPDELNHTGIAAPLDDDEVVRLGELPLATLQDENRPSPALFTNKQLELARVARKIGVDLLNARCNQMSTRLSYEIVLRYDAEYQAILDSLPDYFRLDGVTETRDDVQQIHMKHAYIPLQRVFLQENVHFRMLVLHHQYLLDGLENAAHHRSVDACVEGARVTVAACEELQRTDNPNLHIHYFKWHVLFAGVILQRVISFLISSRASYPRVYCYDMRLLVKALEEAVAFLLKMRGTMKFDFIKAQDPIEPMRELYMPFGAATGESAFAGLEFLLMSEEFGIGMRGFGGTNE
ncbi:hypothetical protein MSPP1_004028, partial [Malassezia sp. CBS 17886]